MKQHITIEQRNELDKKQEDKIFDFFNKKLEEGESMIYGQLTIGMMIELLGDGLILDNDDDYSSKEQKGWWRIEQYGLKVFFKKELADALWEALKHKLKNS